MNYAKEKRQQYIKNFYAYKGRNMNQMGLAVAIFVGLLIYTLIK